VKKQFLVAGVKDCAFGSQKYEKIANIPRPVLYFSTLYPNQTHSILLSFLPVKLWSLSYPI
jgi:hypothetical protein